MSKTYWITSSIISSILIIIFPLIGIPLAIVLLWLVPRSKDETKRNTVLETQIDLIAKQLGISYGTHAEKLEQIAAIAARNYENREGG